MNPIPSQRSVDFIDFSDPKCFTSSKDIQTALEGLARYLNKDNFARVLEPLLPEQALAIELILSGGYLFKMFQIKHFQVSYQLGLPDYIPLNSWIMKIFPEIHSEYDASIASKILRRLTEFFFYHRLLSIDNDLLYRYHRDVEATPKLLLTLWSLFPGDDQSGNDEEEDGDGDANLRFSKIKAKGQKKQSRQVASRLVMSKSKPDTKIL
ncbi:hypothetical protein C0993_001784, partial [Termitomyces sp. T159_Od127]